MTHPFSMTGYASTEFQMEKWTFHLELKSLNHRFLDVRLNTPKAFNALEPRILAYLRKAFHRGRIELSVDTGVDSEGAISVSANLLLAKGLFDAYQTLREAFQFSDPVTLSLLAYAKDVIQVRPAQLDPERLWESFSRALDETVQKLLEMRSVEGGQLARDMLENADALQKAVKDVESLSVDQERLLAARLDERLKKFATLSEDPLMTNRIQQELALLLDKYDIQEEIIRMKSHIGQVNDLLQGKESPCGKKIDFLLQEMNREANTISAKAMQHQATTIALEMKCRIEKLREQCQNIE